MSDNKISKDSKYSEIRPIGPVSGSAITDAVIMLEREGYDEVKVRKLYEVLHTTEHNAQERRWFCDVVGYRLRKPAPDGGESDAADNGTALAS